MAIKLITPNGTVLGAISQTAKGRVWVGLGRSGRVMPTLQQSIIGARKAFGSHVQVYDTDTMEYLS